MWSISQPITTVHSSSSTPPPPPPSPSTHTPIHRSHMKLFQESTCVRLELAVCCKIRGLLPVVFSFACFVISWRVYECNLRVYECDLMSVKWHELATPWRRRPPSPVVSSCSYTYIYIYIYTGIYIFICVFVCLPHDGDLTHSWYEVCGYSSKVLK